ncbi:MAG: hypothetical protein OXB99_00445 [Acidimicrobiaceae bacterium]|nr:hypothetical protein [Acidimicrobiaceae bacterium]
MARRRPVPARRDQAASQAPPQAAPHRPAPPTRPPSVRPQHPDSYAETLESAFARLDAPRPPVGTPSGYDAEDQRRQLAGAESERNLARRAELCATIAQRRGYLRELEVEVGQARREWLVAVEAAKTAGITYAESARLSGVNRSAITQALRAWRTSTTQPR